MGGDGALTGVTKLLTDMLRGITHFGSGDKLGVGLKSDGCVT